MTSRQAAPGESTQYHTTLRVTDLAKSVAFYTGPLGFLHAFTLGDPPWMTGVNLGRSQLFLEPGTPGPDSCEVYFIVDGGVDDLHDFHVERGLAIDVPPGDRHYGLRDYTVRDPDGYRLTFGAHAPPRTPPLEIERVDVPVRLERRIAEVLADLAARKRMSVSECLEETLLHTFEPLGDGVASPHTAADLRFIQARKLAHGIDYDSHGSYRFVERPRA